MTIPFLSPFYLPGILLFAVLQYCLPAQWKRQSLLIMGIGVCAWTSPLGLGIATAMSIGVWILSTVAARARMHRHIVLVVGGVTLPLIVLKCSSLVFSEVPVIAGLSFYALQMAAYIAECCRRKARILRFSEVLGATTFFPTFFAGPIVASHTLADHIGDAESPNDRIGDLAVLRILWGYFKKIVIADRIAMLLTGIYGHPEAMGVIDSIAIGVLGYIRMYADYSGYADIAIGSAALLGVRLPENFQLPYLATSLRDFWRRWNITLSTWLREYVYIPLGGSRCNAVQWCVNILVTFGLSGLWHGTGMRFLLWGLLHGTWMILERAWSRTGLIHPIAGWLVTGAFLSSTFFLLQIPDLATAMDIAHGMFQGVGGSTTLQALKSVVGNVTLVCTAIMLVGEAWVLSSARTPPKTVWLWITAILLGLIILHVGAFTSSPFIYAGF